MTTPVQPVVNIPFSKDSGHLTQHGFEVLQSYKKAIDEQAAEITALEARVAALESP